ncbi:MAG: glycosyltransferase family 9 protein [Deltaproteobacteria bacterium]|jgi:heptosyltransferase-1/heptosyltransferase-2|nr:glycosyltransferase family 9 protein [Deltaproteobacteria bacterium]
MTDPRSILVVKMSALGDVIHALPCLHALRTMFPRARISWLVEPQFAPLLPGPPLLDEAVIFRKNDLRRLSLRGRLAYLRELRRELRTRRFDLALDLQGLLKSTLPILLSGARRRLGYCEMREGSFLFTKPVRGPHADGHVVQRYLDVVRSLGPIPEETVFPLPDFSAETAQVRALLAAQQAPAPWAVLFPGAGWTSKLWPAIKYAQLARRLAELGLTPVIGGAPGEAELGRQIIQLAAPLKPADLVGRTSLRELMALTAQAAVCVGADTGPLHLAAAAGSPTVSLFGPSSGERAGTYGPLSRYVSGGAECSPCFKRRCPKKTAFCMDLIDVETVWEACLESLAAGRQAKSDPQKSGPQKSDRQKSDLKKSDLKKSDHQKPGPQPADGRPARAESPTSDA